MKNPRTRNLLFAVVLLATFATFWLWRVHALWWRSSERVYVNGVRDTSAQVFRSSDGCRAVFIDQPKPDCVWIVWPTRQEVYDPNICAFYLRGPLAVATHTDGWVMVNPVKFDFDAGYSEGDNETRFNVSPSVRLTLVR